MRRFLVNMMLLFLFVGLLAVIILIFMAEAEFNQARVLEDRYLWKKAETKYQKAVDLNPINAKYLTGLGDFLKRQSNYYEDRLSLIERAEAAYKGAARLNPGWAESLYLLGDAELTHSSFIIADNQESKGRRSKLQARAIANFKTAIKNDPYNFRINYLTGMKMISLWDFLSREERQFSLERLEYALWEKPWYGDFVFQGIMYYTGNFSLAEKITEDNLGGTEALLSFIQKNNLWQHRRKITKRLCDLRRMKNPKAFEDAKKAQLRYLKELKNRCLRKQRSNDDLRWRSAEEWQGRYKDGGDRYVNGRMYKEGTMYLPIYLPQGRMKIFIEAKGSPARDIYPYMVVELDGELIGERLVNQKRWREYGFAVDTDGGIKVLSVSFVNDGENPEKGEDRNLYIGEARVIKE